MTMTKTMSAKTNRIYLWIVCMWILCRRMHIFTNRSKYLQIFSVFPSSVCQSLLNFKDRFPILILCQTKKKAIDKVKDSNLFRVVDKELTCGVAVQVQRQLIFIKQTNSDNLRYYSNFTFSRKKKIHFQIWPLLFNWYKTQSQLVWSFEFQSMVKVKVVKWCRKKWNGHNLMYISITNNVKSYKKFTETAQMSNFSDFPLILCRNGPKGTRTMQTQTHFAQIGEKKIPGYAIEKLTSRAFWKCGGFCC